MRPWTLKTQALAATLIVGAFAAPPALAAICLFGGCDVGEKAAKAVLENLLKQRFDKPAQILEFKTTMTERLEMHATGEKGFEYFFNATVLFPEGANLECKPESAGQAPEGCSASTHYVTAPRASDPKGKQYVAPGQKVTFDEEYRFYEAGKSWKGPDGKIYDGE
ncbi:hypothetical protein [Methylocystis bryophila]|uniref:Lipoprotein n=1 Tax=Methylocystis bryophila TaxID=655015 RepID=A0A1W6MY75_9HYPH|nr:hypothetical protein [Methylocystis bryophila]ARN82523.1 hypothetical protein B1812_17130 [Methylocystis bryophila]BDV38724.1 hypothetical protein DSM21852_19770 [Methylocystis bryophila]